MNQIVLSPTPFYKYQPSRNSKYTRRGEDMAKAFFIVFLVLFLVTACAIVEAQKCKPSGKIRGKKPPKDKCNRDHDSDCCKEGKLYTTYKCSPPVSKRTKATLTLNGFEKGGDGGAPAECDNRYHSDNTLVVALSTGWFNKKKRCHHNITIYGNGRKVDAMVVDECDSTMGCDAPHDYQPPCDNNIVDASEAVWKALGVPKHDRGSLDVHCFIVDEAQQYKPRGCNPDHGSYCCKGGKLHTTNRCSPAVSRRTRATLTLNGLGKGDDGGAPECDNKYHSDNTPIVALSTGWFNKMKRYHQNIAIYGNGRKVNAMVVDECDSTMGWFSDHDYQLPCPNNIVDALEAV
ncbi:hypothetical protein RJ641_035536 [Dillenia turbinata]|uniref:Ripening-related protein 1 n=1 Tax=Dillenia turbinata TaxID=194707 RepID=A0AAN8VT70_9MAGN